MKNDLMIYGGGAVFAIYVAYAVHPVVAALVWVALCMFMVIEIEREGQ